MKNTLSPMITIGLAMACESAPPVVLEAPDAAPVVDASVVTRDAGVGRDAAVETDAGIDGGEIFIPADRCEDAVGLAVGTHNARFSRCER